jgi:hypothetical protein
MSVILRNIVALVGVVAFVWSLGQVFGRLAYEGLDVNISEFAGIALLIGVSVLASIIANRRAFAAVAPVQTRLVARGAVIALGSVIFAVVGFVASIQY